MLVVANKYEIKYLATYLCLKLLSYDIILFMALIYYNAVIQYI